MLGLTFNCAKCHDHKYDPITQKEFYSFSAYFNSVNEIGVGPTGPTDTGINVPPILKVPTPDQQAQLDANYQQWQLAQQYPLQMQQFLNQAIQLIPKTGTTNTQGSTTGYGMSNMGGLGDIKDFFIP